MDSIMPRRQIRRWSEENLYEILQKIGFHGQASYNILEKSFHLFKEGRAAITVELCEMKKVHLQDLPNLRSFYSGDTLKWSSLLDNVVLKDCPNIKKLGLGMIKESELKSILITKNAEQIDPQTMVPYLFELLDDKLSLITDYTISNNQELDEIANNLQNSHFTNLQILRINNCNNERLEGTRIMLQNFIDKLWNRSHKLQVINIQDCSLFYFCSERGTEYGKIFTQLKELKLIKVDLRYIWLYDNPEFLDLGNLQILHIIHVSSLEYIFEEYPVEKLHQLKELIIEKCEALSTVFWKGGPRSNFPSLSKLEFKSLPQLRQIYPDHLQFPSLKSLMIETCPLLTKFTTGFADSHEMFTTDGESFFELNEIVFDSYDNMVCVISSKTLQELMNLKKLFVSHCKELKIIFKIHEEIPSSTQLLQQLSELALIHLPKLTCIVNKQVFRFYQNLKILQVKQCKSLTMLQVPLKLTNLEICDCEALDTIIITKEEEEEGIREKLTFHELKDVSLENLPSLSIIFPSISEFPSLQTLKIANCSTMISFIEDSRALQESSTTNYLFPSPLLVEKLKILYVINMNVEKLWHWNYPSKSFCELENLSLTNNNKLLTAISSNMVTRFKNLRKLTLNKCELLTEVFDFEDDNLDHKIHEILPQLEVLALINLINLKYLWNKEPQVSFFSNLVSIYIFYCHNLKSLFSLSSIKNLGKLKILRLCKCDKIEEVISSDISEDENVSIIFPKLECLVMMDLPMLTSFYRQSTTLSLPKLKRVRMSNIPKMKTFSRGILITSLLRSIYVTFVNKIWFGSFNNTISHMHDNPGS